MSGMIERVARAIALASLDPETREAVDPDRWEVADSYHDLARAAIEAMREPTENMLDFGACYEDQDHDIFDEGDISRDVWRAMIDAALSEDRE